MWREIEIGQGYLYRFTRTAEYRLEITDRISVWKEELDAAASQARSREVGAVVLLETKEDVAELYKLLEPLLAAPASCTLGEQIKLEYRLVLGKASQRWHFECAKVAPHEAREVLGGLILEVYGEVSRLEAALAASRAHAGQLEYHLRNLSRLCDKGAYQPHRHQSSYHAALAEEELPSSPPAEGDTTVTLELPSSQFSQALLEFSRQETEEERREKLERQLAPKKKRRRF